MAIRGGNVYLPSPTTVVIARWLSSMYEDASPHMDYHHCPPEEQPPEVQLSYARRIVAELSQQEAAGHLWGLEQLQMGETALAQALRERAGRLRYSPERRDYIEVQEEVQT